MYDPTGHPHAPVHIGNRTFTYDLNGNQTGWTNDSNGTRRTIRWDEENRISQIDDNGDRSYYTYDASGQRAIKVGRQGETVYVNQYYVVRNRSIVSKHIFAGSSRIATHMEMGNGNTGSYRGNGGGNGGGHGGNGGGSGNGAGHGHGNNGSNGNAYAYGQDQQHGQSGQDHGNSQVAQADHGNGNGGNGHGSQGHGSSGNNGNGGGNADSSDASVDTSNLPGNSEKGLENALASGRGHKYGIYKHLAKEGDTVSNGEIVPINGGGSSASTPAGFTTGANGQSSFLYYYHPDHLGSTGFVTDANGKLYEHMEYFPFGETWVDEHSNTLRTPYLFTGKEYDQETGLYYFGARYYDPRTSVWQSPDPILGNMLSRKDGTQRLPWTLAEYTYGRLNPIRYMDPDGRDSCGQGHACIWQGVKGGAKFGGGLAAVVGGIGACAGSFGAACAVGIPTAILGGSEAIEGGGMLVHSFMGLQSDGWNPVRRGSEYIFGKSGGDTVYDVAALAVTVASFAVEVPLTVTTGGMRFKSIFGLKVPAWRNAKVISQRFGLVLTQTANQAKMIGSALTGGAGVLKDLYHDMFHPTPGGIIAPWGPDKAVSPRHQPERQRFD